MLAFMAPTKKLVFDKHIGTAGFETSIIIVLVS